MSTYPGDLRDLVDADWRSTGLPVYMFCPAHTDRSRPSMRVYSDGAHCFTCGAHLFRDQFSALFSSREQTAALIHQAGYSHKAIPRREQVPPGRLALLAHDLLRDNDAQLDYLERRGISRTLVDLYGLGHYGPAYTLPVHDDAGRVITVRFRRDDAVPSDLPKYWGMRGINDTYLYPIHGPLPPAVVLTEGELDTLLLRRYGLPAFTFTNGTHGFLKADLPTLFQRVETVVLMRDQDDAGRASSLLLVAALSMVPSVLNEDWPLSEGKDVTELWQNNSRWFPSLLEEAATIVGHDDTIARMERYTDDYFHRMA